MPAETREPKKSHKYLNIAGDLRRRIQSRELKAGDRLPSFSEMRAMFGATPTTVERVYSLLESENLVIRENGRGIFVAGARTAPVRSSVSMVGTVPSMANSGAAYWSDLTAGIRGALKAEGQTLILCDEVHSGLRDQSAGLILMTYTAMERILEFVPPSFPMVSVLIPRRGITSVCSGDGEGAQALLEHLLQLGHRRIAHLHDGSDGLQALWRLEGWRNTLRAAGIEPLPGWLRQGEPDRIIGNYLEWGRVMMKRWLDDDWASLGCTALTTQNDEMAVGAMQVLQEYGYTVPGQVSVAGFDSTIWCDFVSPNLTSVEVPLRRAGELAAQVLQQQIKGERVCSLSQAENILLPTRLVVRHSTGPAPA